MQRKVKLLLSTISVIILVALVIKFISYAYWAFSPSSTPQDAILKHASKNGLKFVESEVKINESTYVDPNYGKQFTADGIKGEGGQEIRFFYLKNDSGKWTVTSGGTGP